MKNILLTITTREILAIDVVSIFCEFYKAFPMKAVTFV